MVRGGGGVRGVSAGSRGVTYIPVNTPAQSTLATGTLGAFAVGRVLAQADRASTTQETRI